MMETFTVALPSTLQLPPNTACFVLDVGASYGFYTVEAGQNNKLYFWERFWDGTQDNTLVKQAVLTAGAYTATALAAEIQT